MFRRFGLITSFLFISVFQLNISLADTNKVLNLKNSTGGPIKVIVTYIGKPSVNKKYDWCDECTDVPRIWEVSPFLELGHSQEMSWKFDQDICISAWNKDGDYFRVGKYWKFPTSSEQGINTTWLVYPAQGGARKVYYKDRSGSYKSLEGNDYEEIQKKLMEEGLINELHACRYTSLSTSIELGKGKQGMILSRKSLTNPSYSDTEKVTLVNDNRDVIELAYTEAYGATSTIMDGGLFRDEETFFITYKGWIELQPGEKHVVERTFEHSENKLQRGVCVTARKKGSDYDSLGLIAREGPKYTNDFVSTGYFEATAKWYNDVFRRYVAFANEPANSITIKGVNVAESEKILREKYNLDLVTYNCRTYDANTTIFIE